MKDSKTTSVKPADFVKPVVISPSELKAFAKELKGTPQEYDESSDAILKILKESNVAADFGEEGWARGCSWHQFVRNS